MEPLSSKKKQVLISFVFFVMVLITVYLTARVIYYILADHPWYEKTLAFVLLVAESLGLLHSFGYYLNIMHVFKTKDSNITDLPMPDTETFPLVMVVLPSYKEPLNILKDTLICFYNLTYPNKALYLLDDTEYESHLWSSDEEKEKYKKEIENLCQWAGVSLFRRKWRGAKAGIINDLLRFISGKDCEEVSFFPADLNRKNELGKYLIVFDADMNPFPDFTERLVGYMEKNTNMAFIQTPQYYSNFEFNRVARGAGLQQTIFFEYICEGKSLQKAMFCCGTNVLIRIEALQSVGGFDESSVTEDFATSLLLLEKGWDTSYYNRISAFGMGPEDLAAFFKQQFRWSQGTTGVFFRLPKAILHNFRKVPISKWWEYFLSGSHFLIGIAFLILISFPLFYIFFSIPGYFMDPRVYLAVFFPYLIVSMLMFFWTLSFRKIRIKDLFATLMMTAISFPIYTKGAVYAALGLKPPFIITPKIRGRPLPLRRLWPQMLALMISFAAIVWGIDRLYFERMPFYGILTNVLWCTYNFLILSSIMYFNNPEPNRDF